MKTMQKLVIAMAGLIAMTACAQNEQTKFNAKEYAERKTERLDQIVELSDAQEKEVYTIYLAQGKEIQKNIKAHKKECGEMKRPDCKKAECKKAECDKAKCEKPCKKAECDKAKCDKPCKKAECDKAKCDKPCKKAECDKAKCDKPCKKAECDKAKCEKPCKKAECDKAKCEKPCNKAECEKPCKKAECDKPCKKAECNKAECKPAPRHHRRPNMVTPEMRKATFEKVSAVLTPEQATKLKEHHAKRHACKPNKQCAPCEAQTK